MKQSELKNKNIFPHGSKLMLNIFFMGFIGQIAWMVENMYFATFAQKLFENTEKFGSLYYIATTLMVILSAVTATVTTIFAGALSDKIGKRKPFMSLGYIIWGLTIMLFAFIPVSFDTQKSHMIIAVLVIFDCIMTLFGSTANDAAFNAWIADNTVPDNRGRVNTMLAILPVIATVFTIGIAMFTFDSGNYKIFFFTIGILPLLTGFFSMFTVKDSPHIIKSSESGFKEIFYGFSPKVIRENKMMFVCLLCLCLVGIAGQTFMSYLISFITVTLGITDYVIPFGIIILISAAFTGFAGFLYDKIGRKHFFVPLALALSAGTCIIYCMKFMKPQSYLPVLYISGILMLGGNLALCGALQATFQDYIPKGAEGRFQGVRMCFMVLVPMIAGPLISLSIGINSFDTMDTGISSPPFEFFFIASVISLIAVIPLIFVRNDADRLKNSFKE